MKILYEPEVLKEVVARIEQLHPSSTPLWGKMNVNQMMEHCARTFDYATGKTNPPRMLLGYVLGPLLRAQYYNDKPWSRSSPTSKQYTVTDTPEFAKSKQRLLALVNEFATGGPAKATKHPSPFFGKLTAEEQGKGQFKHLDHHLQQFGV